MLYGSAAPIMMQPLRPRVAGRACESRMSSPGADLLSRQKPRHLPAATASRFSFPQRSVGQDDRTLWRPQHRTWAFRQRVGPGERSVHLRSASTEACDEAIASERSLRLSHKLRSFTRLVSGLNGRTDIRCPELRLHKSTPCVALQCFRWQLH